MNLLPVELVEAVDISNAVLWLASDEARYVTGTCLPVDAGSCRSDPHRQPRNARDAIAA